MKAKGQSKAPGVIRKASRLYITQEDVTKIFGCKQSKAYGIVKEVNECAKERGLHAFLPGKANKYIFAEIYGIPLEDIEMIIANT